MRAPAFSVLLLLVAGATLATGDESRDAASASTGPSREQIRGLMEDVGRCFHERQATAPWRGTVTPSMQTAAVGALVAEYLAEAPGILPDATSLCERVYESYERAADETWTSRNRRRAGLLGPIGTLPIETDSKFIGIIQNSQFRHVKGHSDLTLDAWCSGGPRDCADSAAAQLVARASQTPDLYRWSTECFHAHTNEDGRTTRAGNVLASQGLFVDELQRLLRRGIQQLKAGDFLQALFTVGVAAHLAQDLSFHQGITLRQHAGLSYARHRNPDLEGGYLSHDPTSWNRALDLTRRLFGAYRDAVPSTYWSALRQWHPATSVTFVSLARNWYSEEANDVCNSIAAGSQDITLLELSRYYELSLPYKDPGSGYDPAGLEACGADSGLVCWDVEQVFARAVAPNAPVVATDGRSSDASRSRPSASGAEAR